MFESHRPDHFPLAAAQLSRRAVLAASLARPVNAAHQAARRFPIAIFSKHLQFLEGAALAQAARDLGFDGIDLTVRKGGHIEPERVTEDLPPLVSLIRREGLEVPMVTTDIIDALSPHLRPILKTLAALNIGYYRWGGFKYDANQPFAEQLTNFHRRSRVLAQVNAEYRVCAIYHTHSGINLVGAPVWDMVRILNDLDPKSVAINYDIGHATVEGGLGGWMDSFRIAQPHIRGLAFKDFIWKADSPGNWQPHWVPLGTGMVRLSNFAAMVSQSSFEGPIQLHFEYPLGGAENGKRSLTIPKQQVFDAMQRDLQRLRTLLPLSHA